ncbi:hypothetical protein BH11ARM2_BH11ARM2_18200 [soil metagenome]
MSPVTVRLSLLTLLVLGGGRYTYDRLKAFSQIDPFAAFRAPKLSGQDDQVGVVLEGVDMRDYRSGKLVGKAHAKRIDVGKDRRNFVLTDVTDGLAPTKNGPAKFTAKRANYDASSGFVTVTQKATVEGKGYALNTTNLVYNDQNKLLQAQQGVAGKVMNGDAKANNVTLNVDSGAYKMKDPRWEGRLDKFQDAPSNEETLKTWKITADDTTFAGNGSTVETYTNGSASDGEILIKGPKIERDRKTDVLTATGRCFYYSAKANVVADKIVVFRKEKKAVLMGNVILLSKPKDESTAKYIPKEETIPDRPDAKADGMDKPTMTKGPTQEEKDLDKKLRDGGTVRRFPLLIGADKVTYWYRKGERHAEVEGNPQARQELGKGRWRHIWTTTALYDGEKETLLAQSAPGKKDARMKNSYGDDLTAREFLLHTSEGDDRYNGKDIDGNVVGEGNEDDGDKKPTPPTRIGGKDEKPTPPPATPPVKDPDKKTGTS